MKFISLFKVKVIFGLLSIEEVFNKLAKTKLPFSVSCQTGIYLIVYIIGKCTFSFKIEKYSKSAFKLKISFREDLFGVVK